MSTSGESVRQSLLTVALLVVVWLAWMLREVLMLVGFAALLAYALDPIVDLVQRIPMPGRRAMPRGAASGIVILALVVIAGWGLAAAIPRLVHETTRFLDGAPETLARLDREFRRFVAVHGWGRLVGTESTSSGVSPLLAAVRQWSISLIGGAFGNLRDVIGLLLLPVLAFYLLAEREAVGTSALGFLPEHLRPRGTRLLKAIEPALRAYIRGQALVCLVMGTVMAIALQIMGFPVALLLGVIVGLAEIIPYVGFWFAAIAIGIAGFSVSPMLAIAGLGTYVAINNLVGYFVSPRLLGREIKMHPFVVIVSVLAGGVLLGPGGGILALPAAAVIQALIAEFAPRARNRTTAS